MSLILSIVYVYTYCSILFGNWQKFQFILAYTSYINFLFQRWQDLANSKSVSYSGTNLVIHYTPPPLPYSLLNNKVSPNGHQIIILNNNEAWAMRLSHKYMYMAVNILVIHICLYKPWSPSYIVINKTNK